MMESVVNNSKLKEIQEVNLKLLKELKRVCNENDINFFIDSGALIGAVREHDFIAWDDDADVVFLRNDYDKLRRLPDSVWGEDFIFTSYDRYGNGKVFFDCLSHLFYIPYNNKGGITTVDKIKKICDKRIVNRICVDIFCVDYTYDSPFLHKLKVMKWYGIYGLMMGHRPMISYKEYSLAPRIVVWILAHIGKTIPLKTLFRKYEKLCQTPNNTKHVFYSNITLFVAIKKHLLLEWWTDGAIDGIIRGEVFPIPKRYDDILTYEYGDYMSPPKQKEQKPIHFINV